MKVYTLVEYTKHNIASIHGVCVSREVAEEKGRRVIGHADLPFEEAASIFNDRYRRHLMIDEWDVQGLDDLSPAQTQAERTELLLTRLYAAAGKAWERIREVAVAANLVRECPGCSQDYTEEVCPNCGEVVVEEIGYESP